MSASKPDRVVVVGGSLAGLRAVQTAREAGHEGELVLIGEEVHLPYDRPPLSKEFLHTGDASTAHELPDVARLAADLDVDLRLGTRATGLDTVRHRLSVEDAHGSAAVSYDALLVATGVRARSLAGFDHLDGVHRLRTLDDATAVRAALEAGARTVIIGAGFIGAEVASAARRRGLDPVVLEALPTPLARAVGARAGAALAGLHQRNGTDLRCGVSVKCLLGATDVEGVLLDDGTELPADLVVVGIGADPAVDWLEGSGLTLDDGVLCDAHLRAGADVWAAGDVARWHNPLFGRTMRLEHWTNAGEQAAHAMRNLLDPTAATPYSHVPYFWSDWYDQRIQFAGLPVGEPQVVTGAWDDGSFVALYREDDRVVGVLALNKRGDIMKYRALIARAATWDEARALAARRNASAAVPA